MKLLFLIALGALLTGCASSAFEEQGKLATYKQCITKGVGHDLCSEIAGITSEPEEEKEQ